MTITYWIGFIVDAITTKTFWIGFIATEVVFVLLGLAERYRRVFYMVFPPDDKAHYYFMGALFFALIGQPFALIVGFIAQRFI